MAEPNENEEIEMNANAAYYELARTMISDRLREAEHNSTVAAAQAARAARAARGEDRESALSGSPVRSRGTSWVRTILRSRTA